MCNYEVFRLWNCHVIYVPADAALLAAMGRLRACAEAPSCRASREPRRTSVRSHAYAAAAAPGRYIFTGCNLRCVFCQNREISRGEGGQSVSVPRLREIMLRLRDEGVSCIDLVTGTHYTPTIAEALSGLSLGIPVVWNSSGYESVETLRQLSGARGQIYMPDFKYVGQRRREAVQRSG